MAGRRKDFLNFQRTFLC